MAWGPFGWLASQVSGHKTLPQSKTPLDLSAAASSGGLTTPAPYDFGGLSSNQPAAWGQLNSVLSPGASPAGGGGGGTTGVGQPNTMALQNSIRNRISSLQSAYDSMNGAINPLVQEKVGQYLQNYDTQLGDLNKQYGQNVGQYQNIYGARGLSDSSFLGNALDEASGVYGQNVNAINQDKQAKLAGIGQYAQGLTQQAQQGRSQYDQYLNNLGSYSPSDLSTLDASLAASLPQVQAQATNLGTNQQFLNTLSNYAPTANQGTSQLAGKLQQLATSSTPLFAKNQIASGLVKSANLTDPNAQAYWSDYYSRLLNGTA